MRLSFPIRTQNGEKGFAVPLQVLKRRDTMRQRTKGNRPGKSERLQQDAVGGAGDVLEKENRGEQEL